MSYKHIRIYIAGPLVFYPEGRKKLAAMRAVAESYGFSVSLPNDNELKFNDDTPQQNADTIFNNCYASMQETDVIIADLEMFRGTEPDGGTIHEMGMAYAKGCKCYGYTRDKRNHVFKHQNAFLKEDGKVYDAEGRILPEKDFPFNLMITGSSKIIEGSFEDALKVLILDLEEERKMKACRDIPAVDKTTGVTWPLGDKPRAYLAGIECFEPNGRELGDKMKALCEKYGIEGVWPGDDCPGVEKIETEDVWELMYNIFDRDQQHIRNCNVMIADLSDFHGYEPDSGVAFECGMALQLGHKMYGYMKDASTMVKRIPCRWDEENKQYVDSVGNTVENFEYPINLMFASSMKIFEGKFEDIIKKVAIDLGTYTE